MRHRLLAVNDDQNTDSVNELRSCDCRAERRVIDFWKGIPFHSAPNRVTLIPPVSIETSTGSAPRPRGRLESRKRALPGTGTLPGALVSQTEARTRTCKTRFDVVSSGYISIRLAVGTACETVRVWRSA
jgi:hypothetical protein